MSTSVPLDACDVVIAGAGPVGLFLACELALAECSVLVLERSESPEAPLKAGPLGIRGLSVATGEALHRRGLLHEVRKAFADSAAKPKAPVDGAGQQRNAGHFAGLRIDPDKVVASRWKYLLPNPAYPNFAADMQSVETVLAARAASLGVQIRRGAVVVAFDEDSDGVTVHAGGQRVRAKWLVGCDGGRSTVRKLANFEFPGTEPEFTAYSALVDIADPEKLPPGRNSTPWGFYMNEPGRIAIADFDGGAFDRSADITLEHLQSVLQRVSGTDVRLSAVHLATSFTDRARLATEYRRGRVLLAGDAAHIHSALGGQGLNVGLGDAMNLGWKLAVTVKGSAPAGLLDTYQAERRPVGQWVLDWTRAQAAIMKPGPHGQAIERIVRELIDTPDGASYFAEQLWGLSLHYDVDGNHPLDGCSAPDFEFDDGQRLAQLLGSGTGLLLDFDPTKPLRSMAQRWRGRVQYIARAPRESLGIKALLVRPDGFVACACESHPVVSQFEEIASRWFGPVC